MDIDLRIKRDDLYPLYGGGIKARKIGYIVREAIEQGYDALVTNGGPQSNHARATAVVAAALGLKCHLVIVLEPGTQYSMSGNILLMRMSGAAIEYCTKDQLAARMDRAVSALENKGHRPLYIWGGGHCLQGTVAFVEAAAEARRQCGEWIPNYLVLASATGSTQAGLAIGYADLPTEVVGISIARETSRGTRIVGECIDEYLTANNQVRAPIRVIFRDDWTGGGYELYSPELFSVIDRASKAGHYFDPTYSGKGLRGLVSMTRQGEIPAGSRVLLWHTGGLLNLQAALNYTEGTLSL
jgi:1-aminocyclopropane-1-carboxylate deaminase/D-cysteine desulfhydrase-like pyridoxal-dependent ACC family enzyme